MAFELEVELEGIRELLTEFRLAGGCMALEGRPLRIDFEGILPKEGMDENEVRRVMLLLAMAFVPFVGGR